MFIRVNKRWQFALEIVMVILGTIVMGLAFSVFLQPKNISTGGFSGIAMIIGFLLGNVGITFLSTAIIYLVLNIGLFALAFRMLGKRFAIKALIGILSFSTFMEVFAHISIGIEFETLIAAVYGGVLMGVGMGLVVRFGGSTGGTDMIASIVRKYYPNFSMGSVVMSIDACVVLLSMFVFPNGVYILPYTLIALFIALLITDYVNDGYKQVKAFYIITESSKDICESILDNMKKSCSTTHIMGMHSKNEKIQITCLVSKYQTAYLKDLVNSIDPKAFVFSVNVSEVMGEWEMTDAGTTSNHATNHPSEDKISVENIENN